MVKCDVTSEEQTLELKAQTQALTNGRIDVLVNNAGICTSPHSENCFFLNLPIGYTMTAADTDVRQVEKMFAVNVIGPMRMVHHFHRMLVASRGVVVNIGSVGGIVPYIYGGIEIYLPMVNWTNPKPSKLQCKQGSPPPLRKHTKGRNETVWSQSSQCHIWRSWYEYFEVG